MAKTYQEYLAENGATAEEISVLATPKAIAAYNKIQADAQAATEAAVTAAQEERDAKNQTWWDTEVQPGLNTRDAQIVKLAGENARIKAALAEAKKLGLTQVAIDEGHEPPPTAPPAGVPAGFDPKKFVSVEDFQAAFDRTGEAITTAQSLAAEHFRLFGEHLTDFESLRKATVATRGQKDIRTVWEEKYKVADKRAAIEAQKQKEHDDKIVKDTEDRIRQEYATANPGLRPPLKSQHSFTQRPKDANAKQPWEVSQAERQAARVAKFAPKVQ